jgi:hypothetical protein
MKPRLRLSILASYMFLLCSAFQCGKEVEPEYHYTFREQLSLQPARKSYRVGDTIWVQYNKPTSTLVDQKTNQPVKTDSVAVPFQLSLLPRYNVVVNSAAGYCDFVTPQGRNVGRVHSSYGTLFYQEFGCTGTPGYDITVGVILTQPGTYSLEVPGNTDLRACLNRSTPFPLSSLEVSFAISDGNGDVLHAIPPTQRNAIPFKRLEELLVSQKLFMVKVE